jgi:hypothetical protein
MLTKVDGNHILLVAITKNELLVAECDHHPLHHLHAAAVVAGAHATMVIGICANDINEHADQPLDECTSCHTIGRGDMMAAPHQHRDPLRNRHLLGCLLHLRLMQSRLMLLLVMIVTSTIDPDATLQEVEPSPTLGCQLTPSNTISSSRVTSSRPIAATSGKMHLLTMIDSHRAGRGRLASARNDKILFEVLSCTHLAVPAHAFFVSEGACATLPSNHLRRSHCTMGDNY